MSLSKREFEKSSEFGMAPEMWDTFTELCKQLSAQGRKVEALESRIESLERRLAGQEVATSRLKLVTGESIVDELDEAARADAR